MRRRVGIGGAALAAAVAMAVAIGLTVAGADDQGGPGVAGRVPAPPGAAEARRTADAFTAPGVVVGGGGDLVVESVGGPGPVAGVAPGAGAASSLRLTLRGGPFQVRALPIVVQVDGNPIGRARPSPDLAAATVVSFDGSWLHPGAHVTWSYGDTGARTSAGDIVSVHP